MTLKNGTHLRLKFRFCRNHRRSIGLLRSQIVYFKEFCNEFFYHKNKIFLLIKLYFNLLYKISIKSCQKCQQKVNAKYAPQVACTNNLPSNIFDQTYSKYFKHKDKKTRIECYSLTQPSTKKSNS